MVIQPKNRTLLRIPRAVDYLGGAVKETTLRQWIWKRQIEHVRIGRAVCIPQDALDRLIDQGTVPTRESAA